MPAVTVVAPVERADVYSVYPVPRLLRTSQAVLRGCAVGCHADRARRAYRDLLDFTYRHGHTLRAIPSPGGGVVVGVPFQIAAAFRATSAYREWCAYQSRYGLGDPTVEGLPECLVCRDDRVMG